ncbi:MAG: bifunctional hydroxymethylpyrimidine kinase/phosphomethylpyrimidine kinase [Microcoleus sp. PH2017_06_SFM_O_A]|nr:bifunctional hydroxymethylpyrimidine kinase/phosphomethylpyrimidine kinase [Microcoleus sp. PH2017_06_SFM_O_A]
MIKSKIPVALTVAGSDSGGGAGIQADLRTFAFHCVHGTSALTCVTAQNTLGVTRVDALSAEAVAAQIQAVVGDIGVQAAKTGMLLNREIPLAVVVTPNRFEAEILSGREIVSLDDMRSAAQEIYRSGAKAVLVKGGGMAGDLRGIDVWFDGTRLDVLKTETVDTGNTHGTGCTLSAAIAANLALDKDLFTAVTLAKNYVTTALKYALDIGEGQGPVGHFFPLLVSKVLSH